MNHFAMKMNLNDAVESPRIHFEDGLLNCEPGFSSRTSDTLRSRFREVKMWPDRSLFFGGAHSVARTGSGEVVGAADPRRYGVAI